ncbi:hypothetical protein ACFVAV_17840 [Nocardia sp. NPDC057663]|uniref:hypothetical protein n=1 Tax=Nocardia sp. NPDC057663 TaxID=3346201 RepID=UPI00366CB3F6
MSKLKSLLMETTSFFGAGKTCSADPQPKPPGANAALPYQAAGGLGIEIGGHVEPTGAAELGQSTAASLASFSGSKTTEDPILPESSDDALPKAEPQPQLELRVRAIYAVDHGAVPSWTVAHIRAAVCALVTAANWDLVGTGYRFVFFPRHDVEIRTYSQLRQDFLLLNTVVQRMTSGKIGKDEGQKILNAASAASTDHAVGGRLQAPLDVGVAGLSPTTAGNEKR